MFRAIKSGRFFMKAYRVAKDELGMDFNTFDNAALDRARKYCDAFMDRGDSPIDAALFIAISITGVMLTQNPPGFDELTTEISHRLSTYTVLARGWREEGKITKDTLCLVMKAHVRLLDALIKIRPGKELVEMTEKLRSLIEEVSRSN